MRKIMIVIFVLAVILAFSSVRDELLKTRENVRKEIEGTRKEMFVETKEKEREEKNDEKEKNGDIINLTKCCDQDGDWIVFILFDPEKLADFLRGQRKNSLDEYNILVYLTLSGCGCSGGRYTKDLGEIYDYEGENLELCEDHTIKEFAGFVLASSTEVTLTVESSGLKLENGDSVIGFEKNVLFNFLKYFFDKGNGKKIWDVLTSLPTESDYYDVNKKYIREINYDYMENSEEWKSIMNMTKDNSLTECSYVWIYTWWLDLHVPEDTKAGRYSGEIVITISPKNVLQGG